MTQPGRRLRRCAIGALAASVGALALGACTSAALPRSSIRATPVTSAPVTVAASSSGPAVTVVDASGARLTVSAQPVTGTPTVVVNGQDRFAPPGQIYLVETLTLRPSSADFDDPDTGLAPDLELGLAPAQAAAHGYESVCGVEAGDPSSLCPVTLGQGLIVDSLGSAACPSSVAGTSCSQLVVSYGPVPGSFPVSAVSVWFHAAPQPPQNLSG